MALCWNCQNPLPEAPVDRCPSCGVEVAPPQAPQPPPPLPAPPGAGWEAPGAPGSEAAAAGADNPWERRDRVGLLTALVDTTRTVLLRPGEFFRSMPVADGVGSPLLYAVILGWLGLVISSLYDAIFRSIVGPSLAALGDRPELTAILGWAEGWTGFVIQLAFGPVLVVIGVFVLSAIVHLALLLVGGANHGFEATLRVVCFSHAADLAVIVPFCGRFVAFFWALVILIVGLAVAHRTDHGRSAAAVLLPVVLLCCCCVGVFMLFAGALAGLAGRLQ